MGWSGRVRGYWHDSHCRRSIGSTGQATPPTTSVVLVSSISPTPAGAGFWKRSVRPTDGSVPGLAATGPSAAGVPTAGPSAADEAGAVVAMADDPEAAIPTADDPEAVVAKAAVPTTAVPTAAVPRTAVPTAGGALVARPKPKPRRGAVTVPATALAGGAVVGRFSALFTRTVDCSAVCRGLTCR